MLSVIDREQNTLVVKVNPTSEICEAAIEYGSDE